VPRQARPRRGSRPRGGCRPRETPAPRRGPLSDQAVQRERPPRAGARADRIEREAKGTVRNRLSLTVPSPTPYSPRDGERSGVRRGFGLALILLSISATALLSAPGEDDARKAARAFGQALTSGRADGLRPILAEHGRLQLSLVRLGPEEGYFAAGQVEALFRDFL